MKRLVLLASLVILAGCSTPTPPEPPPAPTMQPTAVVNATPTAAIVSNPVADYVADMHPKLAAAAQNLLIMGRLIDRSARDVTLYGDSAWRYQVKSSLDTIRMNGQRIQEAPSVPDQATKLNGMFVDLGKDLVFIADEIQAGLDNLNTNRVENAVTRMNVASARLPEITTEIIRLEALKQ